MKAPHPLTEMSLLAPCSLLFNKLASISFAHINRSFEQKLGFCGHSQSCVPEMTQLMIFAHAEIIQRKMPLSSLKPEVWLRGITWIYVDLVISNLV